MIDGKKTRRLLTRRFAAPSLAREGLLCSILLATDGTYDKNSNKKLSPSIAERKSVSSPSPRRVVLAHAKRDESTSTLRYASVAGGWQAHLAKGK